MIFSLNFISILSSYNALRYILFTNFFKLMIQLLNNSRIIKKKKIDELSGQFF